MKGLKLLFILLCCSLFFSYGYALAEEEEDIKTYQVGEVFDLGEVVISARNETANLATTVTEVTAEDIAARGAQTAADALELVPGVDVQQGGKNATIYLRGFDQEDVKVLIDGVPAYQTYDKVVDLSFIPVDSISKITVTKGASSVLYGANTFGGVINIITKKGGKDPGGEVTVSFGDKNSTQNYVFNYGGSVNYFNYWLTASHRTSDGFELSSDFDPNSDLAQDIGEDGGTRELSDYEMTTFSTKVGYDNEDDFKLYLSFDYHKNEKGIPSGGSSPWRFTKWDQWHLNLVSESKITDIITAKTRIYYVSHKDTIEDVNEELYDDPGDKWFETSSYNDSTFGTEVQTSFDFGPMSFLTVGLNYLSDNHKQQDFLDFESDGVVNDGLPTGFQPEEEYEAETYTVAVEDEIRMLDNDLSFVIGASYDYYKPKKAYGEDELPKSVDSFNPQVGAVYNITDDTSMHASVGKKIRFPRLKELYSQRAGGDLSLEAQETIAYEIGADHFITPDIKTSAVFFYNDITDLIERVRDPITRDRYYENVGEATIQGLEFALDYKILKNLNFGTSYTYLSAYDDSSDTRLLNRPRHKLAFDTRYRILSNLFTNFQASYSTGAYEENDSYEVVRSPGFFLVNAQVNLTLDKITNTFLKDASIFVRADNLFDKDYYEGSNPQAGRSFLFGFNTKF